MKRGCEKEGRDEQIEQELQKWSVVCVVYDKHLVLSMHLFFPARLSN